MTKKARGITCGGIGIAIIAAIIPSGDIAKGTLKSLTMKQIIV